MDETKLENLPKLNTPPSIYYLSNFISDAEEQSLLQHVYAAPKPKWTQLSNRRLQNWGGLPHIKGMVTEELPTWLQNCCDKVYELGVFGDKKPNHVLVNEYLPGQGIMPHTDGPLYHPVVTTINLGSHTMLDFYRPITHAASPQCPDSDFAKSSVNTSEDQRDCQEIISSWEQRHLLSVLLEPRSLVMVTGDMYSIYLHGIAQRTSDCIDKTVVNADLTSSVIGSTLDRTTRVSLTIRHVPKVLKAKLLFGNKK